MRIAIIDSSPLINLAHLDLARQLPLFFDRVYVPRAVQKEVNRKQKFRRRLSKLYRMGFFARCAAADETNVGLLRAELGEGEAEAIIQAQEKAALFFLADERRARQIAEAIGLKPVGTVRLLARLHAEGRAPETEVLVAKLRRDLGFRVSESVVREAIFMASEAIW